LSISNKYKPCPIIARGAISEAKDAMPSVVELARLRPNTSRNTSANLVRSYPTRRLARQSSICKLSSSGRKNLQELSQLNSEVSLDGFALADLGIPLRDLQKGLDQRNASL
jgi:hypothetical protein